MAMAGVFSSGNRAKTSKKFEIRLDSPFVVFHGEPYEADPIDLTGTLILNSADHMNVRSIKIRFEGKWKVQWLIEPSTSTVTVRDKGTIISEEKVLYPAEGQSTSSSHKIAAGLHEWRFSFQMPSQLPESVEGLPGSYIVYDLTAEIDRGYMSKNLIATKHVRVIRTLGRDLTETVPMPYCNEDVWRDKVWYNIYLPTRYYIFGTSVTAEFTLCPLRKGVRIGKIKMEILERVTLATEAGRYRTRQMDNVVAVHEQDMPEDSLVPLTEEQTGIADESYHFKITMPLERSLVRMRQSLETEHIKVWHNLKIYVNLHNPDGHVSQLLVRNLLHIFISPNLPVGDDQCVSADTHQVANASAIHDGTPDAPPTYGLHQLDQLYDDIDTAAFVSGVNTPYESNRLSRTGSTENLRLIVDAYTNGTSSEDSSPSASQLQDRLAALQIRHDPTGGSRSTSPGLDGDIENASSVPRSESIGSFISPPISSGSHNNSLRHLAHAQHHSRNPSGQQHFSSSPPATTPAVQQVSDPTVASVDYDMEALARIPSYNTAVRTPLSRSPGEDGLPTYEVATSRPSTPDTWATAVQPPPQAHTHNGRRDSDNISDSGSLVTLRANAGANSDLTSIPEVAHANHKLSMDVAGLVKRCLYTCSTIQNIEVWTSITPTNNMVPLSEQSESVVHTSGQTISNPILPLPLFPKPADRFRDNVEVNQQEDEDTQGRSPTLAELRARLKQFRLRRHRDVSPFHLGPPVVDPPERWNFARNSRVIVNRAYQFCRQNDAARARIRGEKALCAQAPTPTVDNTQTEGRQSQLPHQGETAERETHGHEQSQDKRTNAIKPKRSPWRRLKARCRDLFRKLKGKTPAGECQEVDNHKEDKDLTQNPQSQRGWNAEIATNPSQTNPLVPTRATISPRATVRTVPPSPDNIHNTGGSQKAQSGGPSGEGCPRLPSIQEESETAAVDADGLTQRPRLPISALVRPPLVHLPPPTDSANLEARVLHLCAPTWSPSAQSTNPIPSRLSYQTWPSQHGQVAQSSSSDVYGSGETGVDAQAQLSPSTQPHFAQIIPRPVETTAAFNQTSVCFEPTSQAGTKRLPRKFQLLRRSGRGALVPDYQTWQQYTHYPHCFLHQQHNAWLAAPPWQRQTAGRYFYQPCGTSDLLATGIHSYLPSPGPLMDDRGSQGTVSVHDPQLQSPVASFSLTTSSQSVNSSLMQCGRVSIDEYMSNVDTAYEPAPERAQSTPNEGSSASSYGPRPLTPLAQSRHATPDPHPYDYLAHFRVSSTCADPKNWPPAFPSPGPTAADDNTFPASNDELLDVSLQPRSRRDSGVVNHEDEPGECEACLLELNRILLRRPVTTIDSDETESVVSCNKALINKDSPANGEDGSAPPAATVRIVPETGGKRQTRKKPLRSLNIVFAFGRREKLQRILEGGAKLGFQRDEDKSDVDVNDEAAKRMSISAGSSTRKLTKRKRKGKV